VVARPRDRRRDVFGRTLEVVPAAVEVVEGEADQPGGGEQLAVGLEDPHFLDPGMELGRHRTAMDEQHAGGRLAGDRFAGSRRGWQEKVERQLLSLDLPVDHVAAHLDLVHPGRFEHHPLAIDVVHGDPFPKRKRPSISRGPRWRSRTRRAHAPKVRAHRRATKRTSFPATTYSPTHLRMQYHRR
jgi:hypothetical protein